MMSGVLSPAFLQAAGRGGKQKKNKITLFTIYENPSIGSVTCSGEIEVISTLNGAKHVDTYSNLSSAAISISADANTEIYLVGDVTIIELGGHNVTYKYAIINSAALTNAGFDRGFELESFRAVYAPALTEFTCNWGGKLLTLDLSGANNITRIDTSWCANGLEFILGECPHLQSVELYGWSSLPEVVLPNSGELQTLTLSNCSNLSKITIPDVSAITSVNVNNCFKLQELNLNGASALTTLNAKSCYTLSELLLEDTVSLTTVDCSECHSIKHADFIHADHLTTVKMENCYTLSNIEVAGCSALTTLNIGSCEEIKTLDLTDTTSLTTITVTGLNICNAIYCHATNSSVATKLAALITANAALRGTVYVNSSDAYYSTIETAAQGAGWTIAPLPA